MTDANKGFRDSFCARCNYAYSDESLCKCGWKQTPAMAVAEVRNAMGAAGAGVLQGGDYLALIARAAPMLLDLAEEALDSRRRLTTLTGFVQNGPSQMQGPCILGCAGAHFDVHAESCPFARKP